MPLSDVQVRNAKGSPDRTIKLSDGGGLQLWITPRGSKLWNVAFRFSGKQRKLSLGLYPAISLKDARERRDAARRLLASGVDPGQHKRLEAITKANSEANTFGLVADQLLAKKRRERLTETTMVKIGWLLDFARPDLGSRPIADITAPEILAVLRRLEARGKYETARRLRSTIGEVFRLAVATGLASIDPTYALRGALTAPVVTHRAAITTPVQFGALLRAVDGYDGTPEVRLALQLLALTFVRPGELRGAEWSEFDLDGAVWSIPGARMKMRKPHLVPLAPQGIALLRTLHALTGRGRLLFPSVRSAIRTMSENTFNAALRRLGFTKDEMTAHGFRAAASSRLNESGRFNPDAIEAQLAHVDGDDVRRAYLRAKFWDERIVMMTWWADRLDEMREHGNATARTA